MPLVTFVVKVCKSTAYDFRSCRYLSEEGRGGRGLIYLSVSLLILSTLLFMGLFTWRSTIPLKEMVEMLVMVIVVAR